MQGSLMLDIGGTWLIVKNRQILRHPKVDGLIILACGIERPTQVRELCAVARAIRPDLLLATDQEGGCVQHPRQGSAHLPAMRVITDNPGAEELTEHCGQLTATEVQVVGLNLSLALVLDLDHQRSAMVGSRASEGNPERVALFVGAFIRGMHVVGVATTGEHFPGHGQAETNSHVTIPEDTRSLEEIRRSDLAPFARLARQPGALVPAHVTYPQVDLQPTGLSRRQLQEVLRGELKFNGVIFSDDLSVANTRVVSDVASRIEAVLAAGCGMGPVCDARASAKLAPVALQRLRVTPSSRL